MNLHITKKDRKFKSEFDTEKKIKKGVKTNEVVTLNIMSLSSDNTALEFRNLI